MCCPLCVACYVVVVVGCLLYAGCWLLFVVCCVFVGCVLLAVCCLQFVVC